MKRKEKTMSLRDKILSVKDVKIEKMNIPEWGVTIGVRVISGIARDEWQSFYQSLMDSLGDKPLLPGSKEYREIKKETLRLTVVDPDTCEPIFSKEDMDAVYEKNGEILERVCSVALRVNGLGAENVKETAKN